MVKKISKDFSIIDKELTIDGTVSTNGRLIVKGILKGTIIGKNVVIAEEGSVYANAKVASMTIGGTFEGEIRALKELILLSTGKCTGKVVCKNLVIETGAILNAQVTCLSGEDTGRNIQNKETIL
ncbi:MAG: polymer-forming cytoskeletal protein [Deltaproteobacteria bacterium]|nr:polymer-forming cytoskeletal protein [Deltaproteobacteria bacterium]